MYTKEIQVYGPTGDLRPTQPPPGTNPTISPPKRANILLQSNTKSHLVEDEAKWAQGGAGQHHH